MLTYETIMYEATRRGMPEAKIRGILREYIQTLMLKSLYKSRWQDKLFFLGGTSLRLLHNSKRFSEDLDFNARNLKKREFENAAEFIQKELKREAISSDLKFTYRDSLFVSEFIFRDIHEFYEISDRRGEIIIKLEANKPKYKLETESAVINGFGELFLLNAMSKGSMFADKIDTLRNKRRGRHVYDIIFMLSRGFPVNRRLLRINGIKEEPKEAIYNIINGIPDTHLKKLSEGVRPFLFDEKESELIMNAKIVVENLLEEYGG